MRTLFIVTKQEHGGIFSPCDPKKEVTVLRGMGLILTIAVIAAGTLASGAVSAVSSAPASAEQYDTSPNGARVSHECFEAADLCRHQVLTPNGHNNGYSFFTPGEPVGSPPAPDSAEVIQRCEDEPGNPPERVCVHSTRTPSGNILSSFQSRTTE